MQVLTKQQQWLTLLHERFHLFGDYEDAVFENELALA